MKSHRDVIDILSLKPTQMTVGFLQVKAKRRRLRSLVKRPSELVDFILEHPIRVVRGPKGKIYVVDHHHLALALIKEKFESAPMDVACDLSHHEDDVFWQRMAQLDFVHPYDRKGRRQPFSRIPKTLQALKNDPYRSLAGFVREAGGYEKEGAPFCEFAWAEYYRPRIREKLLKENFAKALKHALKLAHHKDAARLPGYIGKPARKKIR